jgi:hypothetical protein
MFNKKNILKHAPYNDAIPSIFPAKQAIPEWYKAGVRIGDLDESKKIKILPVNAGFKLCAPFLDSMTLGYMIPLMADIAIKQTEGGPSITYSNVLGDPVFLRDTGSINSTLPVPEGLSELHFVWRTSIALKIPKGYSALITHPLNRFDLPFITLSGVADGEFVMPHGQIPVFFSNTFEGIIPRGTPIAQVILFKQENWSSKIDKTIIDEAIKTSHVSEATAFGYYKNNIWKKKSYD